MTNQTLSAEKLKAWVYAHAFADNGEGQQYPISDVCAISLIEAIDSGELSPSVSVEERLPEKPGLRPYEHIWMHLPEPPQENISTPEPSAEDVAGPFSELPDDSSTEPKP